MSVFLGLMSGTSLDGIDGVAVQWTHDGAPAMQVRGHVHHPFEATLRGRLLTLNQTQANELEQAAAAALQVARAYADVADDLLARSGLQRADVRAVGAHGQTVRHCPHDAAGGFSVQLLNGALLAERCGIDVVCDLRSRDLAAGGQGAPLVPAFHADRFGAVGESRAVLNLGGIANVTLLHADGRIGGFDTGPANVLLDAWMAEQRSAPYDAEGRWAATGQVDAGLLQRMLSEPYFQRRPPKSTGRDLFHRAWLDARLQRFAGADPADVQATLAELTARACAAEVLRHAPGLARLIVCGGGAFNSHLMARLQALLPGTQVLSSASAGLPPQQVEATAFAWLAMQCVRGEKLALQSVTGARGARVLGGIYPA